MNDFIYIYKFDIIKKGFTFLGEKATARSFLPLVQQCPDEVHPVLQDWLHVRLYLEDPYGLLEVLESNAGLLLRCKLGDLSRVLQPSGKGDLDVLTII